MVRHCQRGGASWRILLNRHIPPPDQPTGERCPMKKELKIILSGAALVVFGGAMLDIGLCHFGWASVAVGFLLFIMGPIALDL